MDVYIPDDVVELDIATDWHCGMSSMLYAIASTGKLSTGTARPMEMHGGVWVAATDDEWRLSLLVKLSRELHDVAAECQALDTLGHDMSDLLYTTDVVYDWEARIDAMILALEEEMD